MSFQEDFGAMFVTQNLIKMPQIQLVVGWDTLMQRHLPQRLPNPLIVFGWRGSSVVLLHVPPSLPPSLILKSPPFHFIYSTLFHLYEQVCVGGYPSKKGLGSRLMVMCRLDGVIRTMPLAIVPYDFWAREMMQPDFQGLSWNLWVWNAFLPWLWTIFSLILTLRFDISLTSHTVAGDNTH